MHPLANSLERRARSAQACKRFRFGGPVRAALAANPDEKVTESVLQLLDVWQHSHARSVQRPGLAWTGHPCSRRCTAALDEWNLVRCPGDERHFATVPFSCRVRSMPSTVGDRSMFEGIGKLFVRLTRSFRQRPVRIGRDPCAACMPSNWRYYVRHWNAAVGREFRR